MTIYRVRIPKASDALTDRLLKSGWRMLGSREWLIVGESDAQVRAELARVLPERQLQIVEIPAWVYTLSVGLA